MDIKSISLAPKVLIPLLVRSRIFSRVIHLLTKIKVSQVCVILNAKSFDPIYSPFHPNALRINVLFSNPSPTPYSIKVPLLIILRRLNISIVIPSQSD